MDLLQSISALPESIRKYTVSNLIHPHFKNFDKEELINFLNSKAFSILKLSIYYYIAIPDTKEILKSLEENKEHLPLLLTHLKENTLPDFSKLNE